MILLLDTSSGECRLWLYENGALVSQKTWQADRTLARYLLGFLKRELAAVDKTWNDLTALAVFQGPGSFTGLRIGMAVLNTIAEDKQIPIVTTKGDAWLDEALARLENGENDRIALPFYGREARITTPKK